MSRQTIFEAIRTARGKGFDAADVVTIDEFLDRLGVPRGAGGTRTISDDGLHHIMRSEGKRLKAYPDPASGGDPWTIGFGHTGPDVKPGLVISDTQAEALLRKDVARFEGAVSRLAPVTTQGQFDAMVSFSFNVGEGNLAKSTLLKKHNAGDYAGAANEFGKWTLAAGRRMPGLVTRRADEAAMYRGQA